MEILNTFSKRNSSQLRYYIECKCQCGNIFFQRKDSSATTCKDCQKRHRGVINKTNRTGVYLFTENRDELARRRAAKIIYRTYSDGDINFEKFLELSQLNCYYCDVAPFNTYHVGLRQDGSVRSRKLKDFEGNAYYQNAVFSDAKDGVFVYNGLDRIDQSKSHLLNNVVTCCKVCNFMKRDMSQKEFIEHIKRINECILKMI